MRIVNRGKSGKVAVSHRVFPEGDKRVNSFDTLSVRKSEIHKYHTVSLSVFQKALREFVYFVSEEIWIAGMLNIQFSSA